MPPDAGRVLQVTAALCAAGSVVADCELLSLWRHFGAEGFLSADRLFVGGSAAGAGSVRRSAVLVLLCVVLRLVSSLAILVCAATGRSMLPGVAGYVVMACLLGWRGNLGSNGSDQLFRSR